MRFALRDTPRLVLMLAVFVTGLSLAHARGMPGAAGYAELCLGGTPVMVAVDAEGNPTGEAHVCPEFALSLMLALDAGFVPSPAPVVLAEAEGGVSGTLSEGRAPTVARARGPPVGA